MKFALFIFVATLIAIPTYIYLEDTSPIKPTELNTFCTSDEATNPDWCNYVRSVYNPDGVIDRRILGKLENAKATFIQNLLTKEEFSFATATKIEIIDSGYHESFLLSNTGMPQSKFSSIEPILNYSFFVEYPETENNAEYAIPADLHITFEIVNYLKELGYTYTASSSSIERELHQNSIERNIRYHYFLQNNNPNLAPAVSFREMIVLQKRIRGLEIKFSVFNDTPQQIQEWEITASSTSPSQKYSATLSSSRWNSCGYLISKCILTVIDLHSNEVLISTHVEYYIDQLFPSKIEWGENDMLILNGSFGDGGVSIEQIIVINPLTGSAELISETTREGYLN